MLSPDEQLAFVGCEHTDGVHVVDIAAREVVHRILTGDGSDAMAIWYPPEDVNAGYARVMSAQRVLRNSILRRMPSGETRSGFISRHMACR